MSSFTRLCDGVVEEPLRCEVEPGELHAMHYRPRSASAYPPVLIAPPDGEERDWALRSLVTCARVLASRGCQVLRFDYYGQGESDGNYEETTIASRVADLLAAARVLREKSARAPLVLGVRLGGPIALLAALEQPELRQLALWEPVLDGDHYVQQLLRVNLSTQMVTQGRVVKERPELIAQARAGEPVSVNGYQLSGRFIDTLLELDVLGAFEQFTGRGLVVTTGPIESRLTARPGVTTARVQTRPFWKEPKAHTIAPSPFLDPTIAWLTEAQQLCEVS